MTATYDSQGAPDEQQLLLHAEKVSVVTRQIATTRVRATRTTSTRTQTVEEDLVQERVEVEHVPINTIVDKAPPIRQEGDTTIFPIMEEILVVERRLVLKEEVHVRRVKMTERYVETVVLREQAAAITRTRLEEPSPESLTGLADQSVKFRNSGDDMSEETIVAVYDTAAHAELAANDLMGAGIPEGAISLHDEAGTMATGGEEKGFWSSLFGGDPDHDTAVYDRSVASGSTVVTVKISEAHAARAMEILESHHPIDIDERATEYGLTSTPTAREALPRVSATMATPMDGGTLQLSEERLAIGKRLVNRGGTRIRRFVVETPVEEQITLHDEKVTLERHPITDGRPVSTADFTDKTIEMMETTEEAVVSKQAFVTEEIALKKQATDRVETIRDTVRREDVEIEQIPGEKVTTSTTTTPYTPTPKI